MQILLVVLQIMDGTQTTSNQAGEFDTDVHYPHIYSSYVQSS